MGLWNKAVLPITCALLLSSVHSGSVQAQEKLKFTPSKLMFGTIKDRLYRINPTTLDAGIGWSYLEYCQLSTYLMSNLHIGGYSRGNLEAGVAYQFSAWQKKFYLSLGYMVEVRSKQENEMRNLYEDYRQQLQAQGIKINELKQNPIIDRLSGFAVGFGMMFDISSIEGIW